MGYFDLNHTAQGYEDQYFNFYDRVYRIQPIPHPEFVTSELIFLQAAVWLNRLSPNTDLFDLRLLAVLYLTFLGVTVFFLIRFAARWGLAAQIMLAVLVVFAFSDVGYAAYLNSFFSEPATYVFLLAALTATLYVVDRQRLGRLILCSILWGLFLSAKPQNAPLIVLVAPLFLRLGWLNGNRTWRVQSAAAATVVTLASIGYYFATPQGSIVKPTYYVSVFFGILLNSPTPEQDLRELGLPTSLAKYAGTIPYGPASPLNTESLQHDFFDHISFAKIGIYYLTHPSRLLKTFDRDADVALALRPELGNFEKASGAVPRQRARANAGWSSWKARLFPNRFLPLLACILAALVGALWLWWRETNIQSRMLCEIFVILLILGTFQFILVSVTQSVIDTAKHMFLFNLVFDVCFIAVLVCLARVVTGRARMAG